MPAFVVRRHANVDFDRAAFDVRGLDGTDAPAVLAVAERSRVTLRVGSETVAVDCLGARERVADVGVAFGLCGKGRQYGGAEKIQHRFFMKGERTDRINVVEEEGKCVVVGECCILRELTNKRRITLAWTKGSETPEKDLRSKFRRDNCFCDWPIYPEG
jgi:hypothetical protein